MNERFEKACKAVIGEGRRGDGIGTLGEKTLHAVLKDYYEPDRTKHEIKIGTFYADIASGDHITEIQTGTFYALRKKIDFFLNSSYKVTVVYPVARIKHVCWLDPSTGEEVSRKRSPKKGSAYDALPELFYIKEWLSNPDLEIKIVMLEIDEYKFLDGWGKNKKNNATKFERIPIDIFDEITLCGARDYMMLLPPSLESPFTPHDLSKETKLNLRKSYAAVKVFAQLGCVEPCGKLNNRAAYRIKDY